MGAAMTLRAAIRHDGVSRAIMAYLAARDSATKTARIAAYMELMHFVTPECTRATLAYLTRHRSIIRLRRGWYQRRWEVI